MAARDSPFRLGESWLMYTYHETKWAIVVAVADLFIASSSSRDTECVAFKAESAAVSSRIASSRDLQYAHLSRRVSTVDIFQSPCLDVSETLPSRSGRVWQESCSALRAVKTRGKSHIPVQRKATLMNSSIESQVTNELRTLTPPSAAIFVVSLMRRDCTSLTSLK